MQKISIFCLFLFLICIRHIDGRSTLCCFVLLVALRLNLARSSRLVVEGGGLRALRFLRRLSVVGDVLAQAAHVVVDGVWRRGLRLGAVHALPQLRLDGGAPGGVVTC